MRGQFPCLKFSGLTASSLQPGHIPQPLLEISHNHFTPAEAPDHQIEKSSFHHPHVFAVWSAELNVQWNRPLHLIPGLSHRENIPQISSSRVYLNGLYPPQLKQQKKKRWNKGGDESRHFKNKKTYLKLNYWRKGCNILDLCLSPCMPISIVD